MKRIAAVLSAIVFFFLSAFPVAAQSSGASSECWISVGIYNDTAGEYILNNETLSAPAGTTIAKTVVLLKEKERIVSYTQDNDTLKSIVYEQETGSVTMSADDKNRFFVKLNGTVLAENGLSRQVSDGDIIEWIYAAADKYGGVSSNSASSESANPIPPGFWTETMEAALDSALDWLSLNSGASEYYLLAIGAAGKTAEVNTVNSLLAKVRQEKDYSSPEALARNIMMMSYCGFDTRNEDLNRLLTALTSFEDLLSHGASAAAETLLAYDTRDYIISNSVRNNRETLLKELLALQKPDGGFANTPSDESDVASTAAAVTALSQYMDRGNIREAVELAVDYLAGQKEEWKGFREMDPHFLAEVITALSCAGVPVKDSRFYIQGETLVDILLAYQNPDGGFAEQVHAVNSAGLTEEVVIALSAVKKNGSPFQTASAAGNSVLTSRHTAVVGYNDGISVFLYVIAGLFALLVAGIVTIIVLRKKHRRENIEDVNLTPDQEAFDRKKE